MCIYIFQIAYFPEHALELYGMTHIHALQTSKHLSGALCWWCLFAVLWVPGATQAPLVTGRLCQMLFLSSHSSSHCNW